MDKIHDCKDIKAEAFYKLNGINSIHFEKAIENHIDIKLIQDLLNDCIDFIDKNNDQIDHQDNTIILPDSLKLTKPDITKHSKPVLKLDQPSIDYSNLVKPYDAFGVTGSGDGLKLVIECLTNEDPPEEITNLMFNECDIIFECKMCRTLYRALPNFLAHKRFYCKELYRDHKQRKINVSCETRLNQSNWASFMSRHQSSGTNTHVKSGKKKLGSQYHQSNNNNNQSTVTLRSRNNNVVPKNKRKSSTPFNIPQPPSSLSSSSNVDENAIEIHVPRLTNWQGGAISLSLNPSIKATNTITLDSIPGCSSTIPTTTTASILNSSTHDTKYFKATSTNPHTINNTIRSGGGGVKSTNHAANNITSPSTPTQQQPTRSRPIPTPLDESQFTILPVIEWDNTHVWCCGRFCTSSTRRHPQTPQGSSAFIEHVAYEHIEPEVRLKCPMCPNFMRSFGIMMAHMQRFHRKERLVDILHYVKFHSRWKVYTLPMDTMKARKRTTHNGNDGPDLVSIFSQSRCSTTGNTSTTGGGSGTQTTPKLHQRTVSTISSASSSIPIADLSLARNYSLLTSTTTINNNTNVITLPSVSLSQLTPKQFTLPVITTTNTRSVKCSGCKKSFKTRKILYKHFRFCPNSNYYSHKRTYSPTTTSTTITTTTSLPNFIPTSTTIIKDVTLPPSSNTAIVKDIGITAVTTSNAIIHNDSLLTAGRSSNVNETSLSAAADPISDTHNHSVISPRSSNDAVISDTAVTPVTKNSAGTGKSKKASPTKTKLPRGGGNGVEKSKLAATLETAVYKEEKHPNHEDANLGEALIKACCSSPSLPRKKSDESSESASSAPPTMRRAKAIAIANQKIRFFDKLLNSRRTRKNVNSHSAENAVRTKKSSAVAAPPKFSTSATTTTSSLNSMPSPAVGLKKNGSGLVKPASAEPAARLFPPPLLPISTVPPPFQHQITSTGSGVVQNPKKRGIKEEWGSEDGLKLISAPITTLPFYPNGLNNDSTKQQPFSPIRPPKKLKTQDDEHNNKTSVPIKTEEKESSPVFTNKVSQQDIDGIGVARMKFESALAKATSTTSPINSTTARLHNRETNQTTTNIISNLIYDDSIEIIKTSSSPKRAFSRGLFKN